MEEQQSENAVPVIDFSTPSISDQNQQSESDTQEEEAAFRSTVRKSIRVDADKVDYLMNQVGELVVNRSFIFSAIQRNAGIGRLSL